MGKKTCAVAWLWLGVVWLLAVPGPVAAQSWRYETAVDRMSGREVSLAAVESSNTLSLQFPYAGKNHGEIVVRRHPRSGLNVLVRIDKGQIRCSYSDCTALVRFDDGRAITYAASRPSDGSSDTIFIDDARGFLERARKAKSILVQLEFFRNGQQILEFRPSVALNWPDDRPAKPKGAAKAEGRAGPPVVPQNPGDCERATLRTEGECGRLYAECHVAARDMQQFPAARFMVTCLARGRAAAQAEFDARQAASGQQWPAPPASLSPAQ